MSDKLLQCPFYGGDAEWLTWGDVVCEKCGIIKYQKIENGVRRNNAIKDWNTRPIEDKQRNVIKVLMDALEVVFNDSSNMTFLELIELSAKALATAEDMMGIRYADKATDGHCSKCGEWMWLDYDGKCYCTKGIKRRKKKHNNGI